MKYLFLLRHAKSSWSDSTLADRDRPLNKRGQRDAPKTAKRLASQSIKPDLILSSPALRALTTAQIMATALGFSSSDIRLEEGIYEASTAQLLKIIQELDNSFSRIMLVGHNPGFTNLLNQIDDVRVDNVPTCGLAMLSFDIDNWCAAEISQATLISFDYPKKW
ncbi:MAG: histidine phosphatase family protein [Cyanobacteria bacterium P01_F01_bin.150]